MYTTKTYIYNDDDGSTPCCIIIYLKKPLIYLKTKEWDCFAVFSMILNCRTNGRQKKPQCLIFCDNIFLKIVFNTVHTFPITKKLLGDKVFSYGYRVCSNKLYIVSF